MIRIQQLNLEIPKLKTKEEFDNYQNQSLPEKIAKYLKILFTRSNFYDKIFVWY